MFTAASFLALFVRFCSCSNLQRQVSLHFGLQGSNLADFGALSFSGRFDALELGTVGELAASAQNQVQRRLRLCHNSLFSCSLLHPFRYHFGAPSRAENADIEQMEKIIPVITCEIASVSMSASCFFWCQHI